MRAILFRPRIVAFLLFVVLLMSSLSVFFFTRLDYVVHNELYKYGLQFSYEWAGHYWTYSRLMLDVLSFAIIASITSIVLIFSSRSAPRTQLLLGPHRVRTRISAAKLACTVLASAGVVAIALAVYLDSSILAFIGIGLIFSAVALFYIRSESYIKETLLDKTTFPSLANLGQMMEELGYEGKGVYLPPEYFKGFESSKVYVTTRKNLQLPPPEKTLEGDKIFIDNPNGALLIPPGIELKRLFEKTMGTSFTRIDLQYFKRNMPKLLVEDLEIAQEVEIETNKDRVFFITKNSVYRRICKEVQKLPIVYGSLGCPLCSAIACAIAETTGKLVAVERILIGDDGQTTSVEYSLSEPKREPSRK